MAAGRCFLMGSRHTGGEVWPALCRAVEEQIRTGQAGEFWVGQYGAFDRMAARALTDYALARQRRGLLRVELL